MHVCCNVSNTVSDDQTVGRLPTEAVETVARSHPVIWSMTSVCWLQTHSLLSSIVVVQNDCRLSVAWLSTFCVYFTIGTWNLTNFYWPPVWARKMHSSASAPSPKYLLCDPTVRKCDDLTEAANTIFLIVPCCWIDSFVKVRDRSLFSTLFKFRLFDIIDCCLWWHSLPRNGMPRHWPPSRRCAAWILKQIVDVKFVEICLSSEVQNRDWM